MTLKWWETLILKRIHNIWINQIVTLNFLILSHSIENCRQYNLILSNTKNKYFLCSHTSQNKPACVHHQGQETFLVTTLLKLSVIRNCLCVVRQVWQIILEISKYPLKQLNSQMPRNSVPSKHPSWTSNPSCNLGIYCFVWWSLVRVYCQKLCCFQRSVCLL